MKLSSKLVWAVGSFSYGLGKVTRNGVADNGKVVGFTTEDNVPFFRGELYNLDETDIEEIADFIHPEHHKKIGIIKDIGAGAAFFAAVTAIIIGLIIYLPKII